MGTVVKSEIYRKRYYVKETIETENNKTRWEDENKIILRVQGDSDK